MPPRFQHSRPFVVALVAGLSSAAVFATEGGGSAYPNGAESFLAGAAPPPGTYVLVYPSYDRFNKLRDNSGNVVPVQLDVGVAAIVPRFVWVSETRFLGGNFGLHGFLPLLDIDAKVAGRSQRKSGLGDVIVGPFLAYHPSDKLHYVLAVDIHAPTGSYNANNIANLGRNHWTVGPVVAVSHVQATGFNGDLKVHYEFNGRNKDTRYRSGQEFHFDYSLGWGLGNGWTVGAGGYVYQQTTDDDRAGSTVANAKGRAMAIGPAIKYQSPSGFFITAKYQQDFGVRNRPEGSAFKLKLILPF